MYIVPSARWQTAGRGRRLATANDQDPQTAFMDLMMLTLVPGRERTEAEFRDLFNEPVFSCRE